MVCAYIDVLLLKFRVFVCFNYQAVQEVMNSHAAVSFFLALALYEFSECPCSAALGEIGIGNRMKQASRKHRLRRQKHKEKPESEIPLFAVAYRPSGKQNISPSAMLTNSPHSFSTSFSLSFAVLRLRFRKVVNRYHFISEFKLLGTWNYRRFSIDVCKTW